MLLSLQHSCLELLLEPLRSEIRELVGSNLACYRRPLASTAQMMIPKSVY